jgi:hypothetical protein
MRSNRPVIGILSAGTTVMTSPVANSLRSAPIDVTSVWAEAGKTATKTNEVARVTSDAIRCAKRRRMGSPSCRAASIWPG